MTSLPDDRHHLVTDNLRFAYYLAWIAAEKRLPAEEIRRAGSYGLVIAARTYDESRGVRFTSYAGRAIRQQVGAAIRDRAGLRIVADARGNSRLGREARAAASAARRAIDAPAARRAWATGSLDEVDVETGRPRGANIPARTGPAGLDPDERRVMEARLARLSPHERRVIGLRYGLDDGQPRTTPEIGEIMGYSKQRAQQVDARAMEKLRQMYGVSEHGQRPDRREAG